MKIDTTTVGALGGESERKHFAANSTRRACGVPRAAEAEQIGRVHFQGVARNAQLSSA